MRFDVLRVTTHARLSPVRGAIIERPPGGRNGFLLLDASEAWR
jgi:hypothetical protein